MSRPAVIGISAWGARGINPPHLPLYVLSQRYVSAVEDAGGVPLMLPPRLNETALRVIFDRLDGILLSGGGDINPAHYGEEPHPALINVSLERDQVELALSRWAVDDEKPILTICRGLQVLNVALGGSLVQDIPSQVPDAMQHMFDPVAVTRETITHQVQIDKHTRLHEVIGSDQADVNSWHHQALKRVASPLMVTACSPDGIIEAAELANHRFALGVQWHPEWLYDRQPEMKRLFDALVVAASQ